MRANKILLLAVTLAPAWAFAQDVALPEPVAATPNKEGEPEVALDVNREIDLANVVTSAAKGVTTVQEAPAIITILTADEIKQRGFRWLNQALSTVPGWVETAGVGSQLPSMLVRGIGQAQLELHDGISLFDPWGNNPTLIPNVPLENIKRIEIVTGPGGVLWGANSFLGVLNIISKDADDVNGLEVSAGYGDGNGWKQDFKAYAMFGKSFLKGKLKLFQHISFETYLGSVFELPEFVASTPAPQPTGPAYYTHLASPTPDRSYIVYLDGKYSFGPVSLYWQAPFGENHPQLVFNLAIVPKDTWNQYDRYVILEYKDRYLKDRLGLTAKGYWTQFVRDYTIMLFPPSTLFPAFTDMNNKKNLGGFNFGFPGMMVQRAGATVDMDVNLPYNIRLLFGGEFFWESMTNSVDHFQSPKDPGLLPILCPVDSAGMLVPQCPRTFINDSERYVAALYVDAQWRPVQKLALDAGVRVQKGFGQWGYDWTPLGSAAVVWNFLPDFHLKANYATGFRPPVFISLAAAPGGVAYGANPNLKNELSQSFQGEVNARLLKNVRKVRELELRIDYSYTYLENLIQIRNGIYGNSGKRAIHSVEGYGKLYLAGDHFLTASYTFLYSVTSDIGVARNVPQNWFTFGASFNLLKRPVAIVDVNMNLNILSAYKDPNRYPSGRSPLGDTSAMGGYNDIGTAARSSDLTFDRLSPVALLQLGFRLRFFKERLWVSGQFYNVLNQQFWWPDFFNDLTPTTEMTPTPAPGFNFFASVGYHP
jgi:outer membrane receptor protein involved in Fe transport